MKSFYIDLPHKQTNKQTRLLNILYLNRFTRAIFVLKKLTDMKLKALEYRFINKSCLMSI